MMPLPSTTTTRLGLVGLHTRTLVPGPREGTCVGNGQTAGRSHDLTCRKRGAMRTARHEIVKKCLATALMATGAQIRLEPFFIQPYSGRRADIKVTGPAAPNGSRAALDVSIVAVASNGSQAAAVAILLVDLHTRTLVPGPREGTCVGCGQTAGRSHDLTCRKRGAMRTARHEIVKKCLATALMATGAQIRLEPFFIQPYSGRRADIKVTGPAAPNGSRAALDVSIVAVASNGSQAAAVAILLVDLHTRTLVPGPREGTCVGCGQTAGRSHDLTCRKRGAMRTARHEIVKKCLATASMATGAQIRLEPFFIQPYSGRRADIKVTGPAAPNGSRAALDVSIVAVASNGSQAAAVAIPQDNSGHTSIATLARLRVSAALEARFQQKIADASSENFGSEFVPIVLSSAGTTHPKLELLFGKLKEAGCKLGALKCHISYDVLRARAVTFSF